MGEKATDRGRERSVENGQSVTVKGTDGTVYVQGTSDVTVTVGSYSTNVDTSGAATADSWSDYAVDKA